MLRRARITLAVYLSDVYELSWCVVFGERRHPFGQTRAPHRVSPWQAWPHCIRLLCFVGPGGACQQKPQLAFVKVVIASSASSGQHCVQTHCVCVCVCVCVCLCEYFLDSHTEAPHLNMRCLLLFHLRCVPFGIPKNFHNARCTAQDISLRCTAG
jgi:hypothetical protein